MQSEGRRCIGEGSNLAWGVGNPATPDLRRVDLSSQIFDMHPATSETARAMMQK